MPERFFTADEVAGSLDPGLWQVLTAEARPRPGLVHEGQHLTVHDAIVVARRRPAGGEDSYSEHPSAP
jgi:hypothetical protein